MESHNHEVLKLKGAEWLYLSRGMKYIAFELKVGNYIFDVVGSNGRDVIIVEAKQELQDYLREIHDPKAIREEIQRIRKEETFDVKQKIDKEREKSYKFNDSKLLQLSTERYVICTPGLLTENHITENWGLIDYNLKIVKKCTKNKINPEVSREIMRLISKKNTKEMLKGKEVVFEKTIEFPQPQLL